MSRILPTVILAGTAVGLLWWGTAFRCDEGETKTFLVCRDSGAVVGVDEPATPGYTVSLPSDLQPRFSRGERVLFTADGNPDLDVGVSAMAAQDYAKAISAFSSAVSSRQNDPESQIYLQNARAKSSGNPYTIAVVVPVEKGEKSAQEMLRGVADAQAQFNENQDGGGRLLEVIIANDENNADISTPVSQAIASMPDVLGVVGHNASGASLAAKPAYEKAGIPMISPTSTSTGLKGKNFFRTVPSDAAAGEAIASYVADVLGINNAVVFHDSNSSYSESLRKAFKEQFSGRVVREVDLSTAIDAEDVVDDLPGQTEVILLFPSSGTKPRALSVARELSKNVDVSSLPLLGGDTLYDADTLREGNRAVEDLILAVPWFADTRYADRAANRWGGRVSWRTASSFDATRALIETFTEDVNRELVLTSLLDIRLSEAQTSGSILQFDRNGERIEKPVLVRVVEGGNSPEGTDFGFELVQ